MPDGLKKAMAVARAKRDWVKMGAKADDDAAATDAVAAAAASTEGKEAGKEGGASAQ